MVIGLEDAQPVQAPLAELVRVSGEHGIGLFVDGANYDDVARDKDEIRRAVTLSKLAKFQQLRGVPLPAESRLVARFGTINNDNDRSDVGFLAALDANAVDFVVSQDIGLHRRADRAGLSANVLTIEEALQWVRRLFGVKAVMLPYIVQRKAYEIDKSNVIFESFRADYPDLIRGSTSAASSIASAGSLSWTATLLASSSVRMRHTPKRAPKASGQKYLRFARSKFGMSFSAKSTASFS